MIISSRVFFWQLFRMTKYEHLVFFQSFDKQLSFFFFFQDTFVYLFSSLLQTDENRSAKL